MDLLTMIELEVRARMAPPVARIVTEELRRHLSSMTLGELHALLSTELGRQAFQVPIAEILSTPVLTSKEPATAETHGAEGSSGEGVSWKEATMRFQDGLIRKTLVDCEGNVAEAARRLDLSRSNVYAVLVRFGIESHYAKPISGSPVAEVPESDD